MNNVENVIIIGAGCLLANSIAQKLCGSAYVIGVAAKDDDMDSSLYNEKYVYDPLSKDESDKHLSNLTKGMKNFAVITCTGRFPARQPLSEYPKSKKDSDSGIFESNVYGFLVPYRSTIENARRAERATYITFGSVSQKYNYPLMGIFTAAKDALRSMVKTASHEEAKNGVRFIHLNLSTLKMKKEEKFTSVDAGEFLCCDKVADNVKHFLSGTDHSPFYSEANIYNYSDAYYEDGYLSRVP